MNPAVGQVLLLLLLGVCAAVASQGAPAGSKVTVVRFDRPLYALPAADQEAWRVWLARHDIRARDIDIRRGSELRVCGPTVRYERLNRDENGLPLSTTTVVTVTAVEASPVPKGYRTWEESDDE